MNKNSKGIVHFFLLVVIVIIGIVGLLYYSWQKGLLKTSQVSISPTPLPAKQTAESKEWKIYTNNNTGFSIKVPKNFDIKEHPGGYDWIYISDVELAENGLPAESEYYVNIPGGLAGRGGVIIPKGLWIVIESQKSDASEDQINYFQYFKNNYEKLFLDGYEAYSWSTIEHQGGFKGIHNWVLTIKDNKFYQIGSRYPLDSKNYEEIFNQILSTLRFNSGQ